MENLTNELKDGAALSGAPANDGGKIALEPKPNNQIRVCSRCIMDTTAPGIVFDEKGECGFCKLHDKLEKLYPLNEDGEKILNRLIVKLKKKERSSKYNCIIGVSGGRDSTYLLYLAKKIWGLEPLAVHFNDGFDNPVAGENIKTAVRKLGVDLRTITSDWRESKDIRIAFLKASVPNLEVGTDLGIFATLYGVAAKENVKHILTAHSFRTEGISPLTWNYLDGKYLKSILERFGTVRLREWKPDDPGYNLSLYHLFYYMFLKRIQVATPMYYIKYVRKDAEPIIEKELGWVNPGAHYFDDLWQSLLSYVYRVKFNADKRKFNYSALIRSGQMTREEALERVRSVYVIEDPKIISLCIKRLGISQEKLNEFISYPPKTFQDYPNYYNFVKPFKFWIKMASRMQLIPAGTYDKLFNCI
ncbi:MAG: N-acetyl sugar amidotransferase [Candidatus Omnitrophota bacterium]|nr:N-acetyl sugar amidotransferase [Candidatus Omnitrophota bacterium]